MKDKTLFIDDRPTKTYPIYAPLTSAKPKPLTMEQRIVVQLSTIREKFRSLHFRKVKAAIKARDAK